MDNLLWKSLLKVIKGLHTNAGMMRDRISNNEEVNAEEVRAQKDFTAAPDKQNK